MSEMIDTHVHLKAICREGTLWNKHNTGVIDEIVDGFVFGGDITNKVLNRSFRGEV
jgi:hypothetical protein